MSDPETDWKGLFGDSDCEGTPERAVEDEEPPSVLARRIMRAHDNPSPPPAESPQNLLLIQPDLITFDNFILPSPTRSKPEPVAHSLISRSPSPQPPEERVVAHVLAHHRPSVSPRRSERPKRTPNREPVELTATVGSPPKQRVSLSPMRNLAPLENLPNEPSSKTPLKSLKQREQRRMLDSLSPGSSDLLTNLLPSFAGAAEQVSKMQTAAQSRQYEAPVPDVNMHSPRRITVDEKVAQGHLSPQKAARLKLSSPTRPTKAPLFIIPPNDSPARRVVVGPESPKKWDPKARFGSPTRNLGPTSSASGTSLNPPSLSSPSKGKQAESASSGSAPSLSTFSFRPPKQLPFPITTQLADPQPPPPELSLKAVSDDPQLAKPKEKIKSGLKHSKSKIPRIKPYNRPPSGSTSQKPIPARPTAKLPSKPHQGTSNVLYISSPLKSQVHRPEVIKPSVRLESPKKGMDTRPGSSSQPQVVDQEPRSLPDDREQLVPSLPLSDTRRLSPSPQPPLIHTEQQVELPQPPAEPVAPVEIIPIIEGSRRSMRNRRPATGSTGESRPIRRRAPTTSNQADSGPFSTMSAVALRALTTSNTVKNQRYMIVELQTRIIRKDGVRPESPLVKVKSVAQREKEEKEDERRIRAERRAKRASGEGLDDIALPDEPPSDDPFQSEDEESPFRVHKRGAGEDEDYITPLCPSKKVRLDNQSQEHEDGKKRVKWDRGLAKSIFLDEVQPRPYMRPKDDTIKKGCLAPSAKALRLDNLGNLPNAESPMKELVKENVEVTKIVYDNDVVEPVIPLVEVKTTTRSRSKKGKS